MFIPLKDDNPLVLIRVAYVNWSLIAANILVFIFVQKGIAATEIISSSLSYGFIPALLFGFVEPNIQYAVFPEEFTLVTYMFLHGGWLHLLANMMFLWVFGDNVEDAIGHVGYLFFYLVCGVLAGLAHGLAVPMSNAPLVGASGAVAGVMGAYFLLHPRVRVWVLLFWRIPLPLPAILALGIWIAIQVINAAMSSQDNVAWWSHLGGFAAGAILIIFMRRKSFPLFNMR